MFDLNELFCRNEKVNDGVNDSEESQAEDNESNETEATKKSENHTSLS